MVGLPSPVSVTDEYLRAIHGVLGEIRDRLPAPKQEPAPGPTRVSEPAKRTPKRGSRGGS
jgi:hypothetical protein